MRVRSTVRWRLTAFYGFVFFVCGAMLLVVSYLVVRQSLIDDEQRGAEAAAELYGLDRQGVEDFLALPLPREVQGPRGESVDTVGGVIDGVQVQTRENVLEDLLRATGAALVGMVALAVFVGWLAAGRALRPVKRLTATARSLSETTLDKRIALDGPEDELKELADTLDGMLARLEVAFVSQRRFAADVSHELRTPLSIVRGEAEVTLGDATSTERERRLARAVQDAALRAEALIESLLALARSDSTMWDRDAVDLAELTGDVVGERVEAASSAGVEVDLDLGSAVVEGDRWLLERLVANLVDNGINHNRAPGRLQVAVDARNGSTEVRVSNTGDVLSESDIAEILKPFHRLEVEQGDEAPDGFGLGMTIVQSVAEAHDGTIRVEPRSGGGLDVVVTLPTAH